MAVRVGVDEEDDHVVEDAHRLGVGAAEQLVDRLGHRLGAERLGRVQAAVDPHHRLALGGELRGLLGRDAVRVGQSLRDVAVVVELLVIGGRGDDRHQLAALLGRVADVHDLEAVRFLLEFGEVVGVLLVVDEVVIVAEVEAELLLGRGDSRRIGGASDRSAQRCRGDGQGDGAEHGVSLWSVCGGFQMRTRIVSEVLGIASHRWARIQAFQEVKNHSESHFLVGIRIFRPPVPDPRFSKVLAAWKSVVFSFRRPPTDHSERFSPGFPALGHGRGRP